MSSMTLVLVDPQAAWTARAEIASTALRGSSGWLALEALRRPHAAATGTTAPRIVPRIWSASLRLTELRLTLPVTAGEGALALTFASPEPVACVFDHPGAASGSGSDVALGQGIATAFALELAIDERLQWPAWVKSLGVAQSPQASVSTRTRAAPAEVFALFGLEPPRAGDALIVDVDGVAVRGRRRVPWWDPANPTLPGTFRLERVADTAGYRLRSERSPQWQDSLRRYQAAVVDATEIQRDEQALPTRGSPAIGLAHVAGVPEVSWVAERGAWSFRPQAPLFEVELRGAGGSVARWRPPTVEIDARGVRFGAAGAAGTATLAYQFDGATNLWRGDLDLRPERASAAYVARVTDRPATLPLDAWIATDTGMLSLPLPAVQPPAPAARAGQLRGLLTLGVVPWRPISDAEHAAWAPDFARRQRGTLVVSDFVTASASFELAAVAARLELRRATMELGEPEVRLEEAIPVYVPPAPARTADDSGPPPWPDRLEPGRVAPYFVGLTLVRSAAASEDVRLHAAIRFAPGRNGGDEGAWLETALSVDLPAGTARTITYWYQPPDRPWIPRLPYHEDPRRHPERCLSLERLRLPLLGAPGTSLRLRRTARWEVRGVERASFFTPPDPIGRLFAWAPLDVPGVAIAPAAGPALVLADGRPVADARFAFEVRHDLPALDELFALRVDTPGEAPLAPAAWWRQLAAAWRLSRTVADELCVTEAVDGGGEIAARGPVAVRGLVGGDPLPGAIDASLAPPRLAITLDAGASPLSLIGGGGALRGVDARGFSRDGARTVPSADGSLAITAGTFVPQRAGAEPSSPLVTQLGELVYPSAAGQGRMVAVGGATCCQWSCSDLELSDGAGRWRLRLHTEGLPVAAAGGRWAFTATDPLADDPALRDFGWGAIGEVAIWGLPFQPFELRRVEFADPLDRAPTTPVAIEIAGVLGLRAGAVRLVDPDAQLVTIVLERRDSWKLASIAGRVLWPMFEPTPDLADAAATSGDALPWLEAGVEMTGPGLRVGTAAAPALLVLRFLDRTWEVPVALAEGVRATAFDPATPLRWQVSARASGDAELAFIGGELVLAPRAAETRASLSLRGAVRPPGATTRTSLVVQGTLAIARDGAVLSVQSVELLTVRPGVSLAAVTLGDTRADAPAAVHVSPQKLGLTVNLPRGSRSGRPPFELLPGWSIGADAAVHGYASLDIAPPSPGRISAAAIVGMQLVVETELDASAPEPAARPPALGAVLTCRLRAGAAPALALRLTGEYRAQSVLRWASEDGQSRLHHTVGFVLRQATLPDLVSDDAAASFLTVSAGAVIELPCLATHSIVDDAEGAPRELLTWVAAQRLRIGSVTWFAGDVLLRASNRPSVLEPNAQREKLAYQDPRSIETGFVGALGAALNTALTGARESTMVIEASEAFWLAPAPAGDARRSSVALWRSEHQRLDGTPSSDASFELDRGATWLRLPMPFLTDTRGVVRAAGQATPALAALLDNATQPPPTPRRRWARWRRIDRSTEILGRGELVRRGSLDRYSRSHVPLVPGYGGGMDQVVLRTVAYEAIVPYTLPLTGFAPGSLIFRMWRPSSGPEVPFGATLEVLNALIDPARAIRCTAATELVPDTAGNGRPYLLASPLSELTLTEGAVTAATAEPRQRVVLEVWLPDDHPGSDGAPALAARAVFHVPVAVDDDWEAVLSERDPAQTMRQRPRLWVAQLEDTLAGAALLRATALDAGPLPAKRYFLLGARALPIVRASGPRGRLGVAAPAQPDLRYRALAAPIQDPLMTGPDCLAGRVYHEERSWYRAPRPTPDNDAPGPIAQFDAQPDSIARGEEVTFRWTTDSEAILALEVPGHPPLDVSGRDHAAVRLETTTLVGLRAVDDRGATIGYRETAVVVAVPVAGSAVGLAYKLAGTAAGPRHRSRLARTDAAAGGQRWLELTRDVVFGDATRPPAERPQREPGWYLPPARVLAWESAELGRSLACVLATRTTAIYASGRAGALVRVRAALLHETGDGAVHRSASFPHALRHPRPVHLPEELRAVCAAAPLAVPAPFHATELTWRDPLYDRRLFAVGQSGAIGRLTLALDRSRYGAVDVLYPEVVLDLDDLGAAWSIALRLQLVRDSRVVDELAYAIGPAGLTRAGATTIVAGAEGPPPRAGKRRWVLELGLAQPEAADGGFGATPQDKDELLAIAELRASPSTRPEEPVSLTAVIRAQSTWPQPQNAFAVVRSRPGAPDALVAFGWLVAPVVVRREDRFRDDEWTGMFRHRDVALGDAAADARFTIQTITSYGESS